MTRRLRVRPVRILAAVLAVSLAPAPAAGGQQYPEPPYREDAQADTTDWSDRIPAHVSVVDGTAELERDGQREAAEENVPLLAGDRLRTARGRVEVLFSDGSALAVDEYTDLDLLSDSLVRVEAGRIRLAIARGAGDLAYRVDAAGTTTWLRSAGEYRIAVDTRSAGPDVVVAVLRGTAELESAAGRTLIRSGLEARANARTEPSLPYPVNVSAGDAFDRWALDQQRYRSGSQSAQYLPAELRHYGGAFDRDGAWEYEQGYGYVWFPTVVADWRPYYYGGWSFYGSFGWTWVGGGRWTWPTHHYGRWGLHGSRWFWVPGRRWAPAWVSWASAPGYLGWCPLGFDNRPVIAITNITVYGGDRRHGWTVLPYNRFGPRVAVSRYAVPPHNLRLTGGARFTAHASSPVRPSFATRSIEPLRAPTYAATRYAVPRTARSAPAASIATAPRGPNAGADDDRSAVARGRSAASPVGRPGNPVTRPSGPDDGPSERGGTIGSAGPRSRSNPSAAPEARPGASQGSGSSEPPRRAVGRRSSSVYTPAPEQEPAARTLGRRPSAVPYESSPRRQPSRQIQSAPSVPRPVPSYERTPRAVPSYERAPRIERSAPRSSPGRVESSRPAASSRAVRSAPMSSPRIERSAPSRPSRADGGGSPRSSSGSQSSESRGQARRR